MREPLRQTLELLQHSTSFLLSSAELVSLDLYLRFTAVCVCVCPPGHVQMLSECRFYFVHSCQCVMAELPSGLLEACVVLGASSEKLRDVHQVNKRHSSQFTKQPIVNILLILSIFIASAAGQAQRTPFAGSRGAAGPRPTLCHQGDQLQPGDWSCVQSRPAEEEFHQEGNGQGPFTRVRAQVVFTQSWHFHCTTNHTFIYENPTQYKSF